MKLKKVRRLVASVVVFTTLFSTTIAEAATQKITKSLNTKITTTATTQTQNVLKVKVNDNGSVTYAEPSTQMTNEKKKFSWDNATVYFALTDRFNNGDTSNDHSYGRGLDKNGNVQAGYAGGPGAFQGGDLKGLTAKLKEGYFTKLGVNAIWITAPYEQIHGFTSGNDSGGQAQSNGKGFPYYGYHGYWALDYSNVDANMGTAQDLKEFVDTAHSQGVRVVMDIVLNHVGYATMKDVSEYGCGGLAAGWENYYYGPIANLVGGAVEATTYYNTSDPKWATKWWGPDFVRSSAGYAGYPKASEGAGWTDCLAGLPDIKTESTTEVGLPPLLETKWKREGRYDKEMASLDAFFKNRNLKRTPRNYVIKWLTDYIREYGIDGFRCDTANEVDFDSWAALNREAKVAFEEYKAKNPDKVLDKDAQFWTVGESWGHGVNKSAFYTSGGFDAMLNFGFKGINLSNMQSVYRDLSKVNNDDSFNVLSYISSHDDGLYNRDNLINGGTALLLAPGAVQIFYGDETARSLGWTDRFTSDYKDQTYRTFMNWSDLNDPNSKASVTLSHWQKVGQFRNNHLAVGAGKNIDLAASPYTFGRIYNKNGVSDRVVCAVGASGVTDVNVSGVFNDGAKVRDAYTGAMATVTNGKATFTADKNGVILIEKGDNSPDVSIEPNSTKYYTDTLNLTLYASSGATGTYSIDGGAEKSFVNGDSITIGQNVSYGTGTIVTIKASNSDGTATQTCTYTKMNPNFVSYVYFRKPQNYGTPKVYIYNDDGGQVTEVAKWPGVEMTLAHDDIYTYTLPKGFRNAKVIFTDGRTQMPGQGQPGLSLPDGDTMIYDNGVWKPYVDFILPQVSISQGSCTFYDSLTLKLGCKNATTATYSINGADPVVYSDGDPLVIGKNIAINAQVTVTLRASDGRNMDTETYTYTKIATPLPKISKAYCKRPQGWGTNMRVYIYNDTVSPIKEISKWPGVAMKSEGNDLYSYELPADWGDAKVIFTDGKNQTPGAGKAGLLLPTGSAMIYDNGNWQPYK
ncbi:starch-binding protein [Inconstantimicrobium mannanitabidum]|uniref:Uncharacterized protein n=1 Tax=Inconstantimicrobium mannanitabidum TaxID=1604901 RepID=A0ACB5RD36_9CLOT|nr:starch-binding protein [Clostridium sp. TW13]GKX67077.1 hypothetical protein rsdtw13_23350 [Clostridium sp. TW13]